jgi:hypothetical protein
MKPRAALLALLALSGLLPAPLSAAAAAPVELPPRPWVWAVVGIGATVPATHPGAAAFFDTMDLLHERSKDGPSRANLRLSGRVGVPVLAVLDVVVEGGFWYDALRGDHEWLFGGDLGASVRYAPWRWRFVGVGFLLGAGAAFPTHRVEGRDVGRATGYGRAGVDVLVEGPLAIRGYVEYTLVHHGHAFEGSLAHPVGGLAFGFELGFQVPRAR